jgi:hypothetical protein
MKLRQLLTALSFFFPVTLLFAQATASFNGRIVDAQAL